MGRTALHLRTPLAALLTPVSKITAVNSMLYSISERPVTVLDEDTRLDVIRAEDSIDEVSRMEQEKGWFFNYEPAIEIAPNQDGEIRPPSDVLQAKVSKVSRTAVTRHYMWRGTRFYNRTTQSYTDFTDTIRYDLTRFLAFDELPATARTYIYLSAGVLFQMRSVGSEFAFRFTRDLADRAWPALMQEEIDAEGYNIFGSEYASSAMLRR